jgi:hypothetical protein
MDEPGDFRQNAEECIRLAEMASSPDSKAALMEIARTWMRLADVNDCSIESHDDPVVPPDRQEQQS